MSLSVVEIGPQPLTLTTRLSEAESAAEKSLTDGGNARRLVASHGHEIRWVPHANNWIIWNGTRWQLDVNGEIMRRAMATARDILVEASLKGMQQNISAEMAKHAIASESVRGLRAMIEIAKSLEIK
jgi:hypothetical protein